MLYLTIDWHTAFFTVFSLLTRFVNFHWLFSAHMFFLFPLCKMFFLEPHIFFLLRLYNTFFFLKNEFWISYWKALRAFKLFPLWFALMNTFHKWSGRLLVPSGRQCVSVLSALQITTGLPACLPLISWRLCFLPFRQRSFFCFRPQNLSMQFSFQCLYFNSHIIKIC